MAVFQGLLNCYSIKCERESEREHAVRRQKKKTGRKKEDEKERGKAVLENCLGSTDRDAQFGGACNKAPKQQRAASCFPNAWATRL